MRDDEDSRRQIYGAMKTGIQVPKFHSSWTTLNMYTEGSSETLVPIYQPQWRRIHD